MKRNEQDNSTCLIERARTDKGAFSELFRRHYDEIFRYCARRLPCRQNAEDVTSSVFLKMVGHFNTFSGDLAAFRNWLFRIACNEVNSFYRRSGRESNALDTLSQQPTGDVANPVDTAADGEENAVRLRSLRAALATLEPPCRDIVTLRFFEGFNSDQIGDILDMKPATVRSRLARALKKMKTQLQNSGEPCFYE